MSNENSNLRVGSAGAGLFVGSTEILGSGLDISALQSKYVDRKDILIINLSDVDFTLSYDKGGSITVPPNCIDLYEVTDDATAYYGKSNGDNTTKRKYIGVVKAAYAYWDGSSLDAKEVEYPLNSEFMGNYSTPFTFSFQLIYESEEWYEITGGWILITNIKM